MGVVVGTANRYPNVSLQVKFCFSLRQTLGDSKLQEKYEVYRD